MQPPSFKYFIFKYVLFIKFKIIEFFWIYPLVL